MVYANPAPAELASGQYYDQAGADYYLSPAKLESDYAPVRFERELRLFRRHCAGGAVLDVGCSTGGFLYQLNRRFPGGYTLLGADASGPALAHAASRGVPVIHGSFPDLNFAGKQFDAVTFWAVFEHLLEPKVFLEKAASVLKPHGLCLVLVPNGQSLAARLLGARYRYIYPQHLNYFTRSTLTRLVSSRFSPSSSARFTSTRWWSGKIGAAAAPKSPTSSGLNSSSVPPPVNKTPCSNRPESSTASPRGCWAPANWRITWRWC